MKFKIFKNQNTMFSLIGLLIVFLLWQILTSFNLINPIFLSSPSKVFEQGILLFSSGFIWVHLWISLNEFILGFIFAVILGVSLGIMIGWFNKFDSLTKAIVYALYATPIVAIFPLVVLWFGLGIWPKVFVVFLASFFPILISTKESVINTHEDYLKLAKSFNTPTYKIIRYIIFPSSLPNILSGIKIALPRGIVGVVIGEFYTGNMGLGYLISFYGATFDTAKLLAVVLMLIVFSIFINMILDFADKKVKYWKL